MHIFKRQGAYIETGEVWTEYKEKLFHQEDSKAVEQAAQRCYAISVLRDFKSHQTVLCMARSYGSYLCLGAGGGL